MEIAICFPLSAVRVKQNSVRELMVVVSVPKDSRNYGSSENQKISHNFYNVDIYSILGKDD